MRQILVICADARMAVSVAACLETPGTFAVVQAESAMAAKDLVGPQFNGYDAVIIDTGLDPAIGPDACIALRRMGVDVPILLLSEAKGEADIVRGLDSGANDYIVKPFRGAELLARLRAQLRVFESSEASVRRIGPYSFQPSAKLLLEVARNRTIRLTAKEVEVLKFLHRADGRPVTKHTLLMEVWGYSDAVNSHTLETHIWRLRQKIEHDPSNARLILSNRDGYLLTQAA